MKLTIKQKKYIDKLVEEKPEVQGCATMTPDEYDRATNFHEVLEMEDLVDDYIYLKTNI